MRQRLNACLRRAVRAMTLGGAMAVTISFGLGFATVLTMVVVPLLYAIFFKVHPAAATS